MYGNRAILCNRRPINFPREIWVQLTKKEKEARALMLTKEREEVWATMNPALQKATSTIEATLVKFHAGGFQRTWKLGEFLVGIRDDPAKYGVDPLTKISQFLRRFGSDSMLAKAQSLFSAFKSEELDQLLEKRMKATGTALTWGHVEQLLTIKDKKKRDKYIDETCENDWTPNELAVVLRNAGQKAIEPHAGGRPVRIPATISGRLENFINQPKARTTST